MAGKAANAAPAPNACTAWRRLSWVVKVMTVSYEQLLSGHTHTKSLGQRCTKALRAPCAGATHHDSHHLSGTVTIWGNSTIKNSTAVCAKKKGSTPLKASSMALFMMNSTPK
jgi:hypothetical protein